ncbi:MAG: hypothetical protein KatS3mg016_1136 [Fimbriimonadales bacterium]|nr:MAG: hypothetical protein KatS3mg016_1136 [Fimbriimonadales bacterium]
MKCKSILIAIGVMVTLFVINAHATTSFVFNTVYTGGTPSGTSPWAKMTIQDITGGVQITLNHSPLSASGQFISEINLKFNTAPTGSNFAGDPYVMSIGGFGGYIDAGLSFNASVRFKVSPPASRLLPGGSSTFKLFGVSESNFVGGDTGAMIHIQGLPGGDSSKVVAPEPASMLALGVGLTGLLGLRRRKR